MANIQYADDGIYTVGFHAEDDCGNRATGTRTINVRERQFTISFNSKGGSVVASVLVDEGDDAGGFASPTNPPWAFKGWYDNYYCYGDPITFIEDVQQDYTLYAKWGEETYSTIYFNDFTLAINVPDSRKAEMIRVHGAVLEEYPALDDEHPYIFTGTSDRYWNDRIDQIFHISIESPIKPTSLDFWFKNLTHIEDFVGLDNIDTSRCTTARETFAFINPNVTNLDLDLSSWDVSSITTFFGMFHGCNLMTLDITGWVTSSATTMQHMFTNFNLNAVGTKSLDLTTFDFSNVTNLSYMFENTNLEVLTLGNPDTARVTTFHEMFDHTQLVTIYSDDFDTSSENTEPDNRSVFFESFYLVGGNGYHYGSTTVNSNMAVVDKPGRDGYFTMPTTVRIKVYSSPAYMESVVVPTGELFTPTWREQTGQYFIGWHFESSMTDPAFESFVPTNSCSIYAEYVDKRELTYHQNNGEADVVVPIPRNRAYNLDFVPISTDPDMTFAGWYDNASLTGSPITTITSNTNTEVWAKWDERVEGTHYLFADGTFAIGLPDDQVDAWRDQHGYLRGSWTNDFSSTAVPWYNLRTYVEKVVPGSARAILWPSEAAFKDHAFIKTADITNLVGVETAHGKELDLDEMFSGCTSLQTANIDIKHATTNVVSSADMFYNCRNVSINTGTTANAWSTGALTNCSRMFYQCRAQSSFYLDKWNFNNVTDMSWMFYQNVSLTKVKFPADMDTQFLTNVTQLFSGCELLSEIENLGGMKTTGATLFAGVFATTKVTELDLSGFDTTQATSLNGMFKGCDRLVTIYGTELLSNSTATNTGNLFENCSRLVGGAGTVWDAGHTSDRDYLWLDGKDGRPGYVTAPPTIIYASFDESTGLFRLFRDKAGKYEDEEIIGTTKYWADIKGESDAEWYTMYGSYVLDPNKTIERYITRFETDGSEMVFKVGSDMCGLENVTYIDITGVKITHDAERMFSQTNNLQTLIVSQDWIDPAVPIDIHNLFFNSSISTQDLNEALSKLSAVEVTDCQGAFARTSVTSINMVELVGTTATDCASMFGQCRSLRTIIVDPNRGWDMTGRGDRIGAQAFYECTNLIGGAGTGWNSTHLGSDYFCIDNPPNKPGYLTSI